MVGMQASAITATWVHTAHELRFTIKPTKSIFNSDEPVVVEFIVSVTHSAV